jgi:hypothetical protein
MARSRAPAAVLLALALVAGAGCRRWIEPVQLGEKGEETTPDPFDAALAQGELAFAARGEPARLAEALDAFGRAAALRPRDAGAQLWVARSEAFRALASVDAPRSREAWLASARAAERALRRMSPAFAESVDRGEDPATAVAGVTVAGAEPLYLVAQGSMRSAQLTGYAAVLAVKDSCLAMMARAAELDERVDAAGPHRALGAWRASLPIAAGGGATASRGHFDRARTLHPTDLLARVAEAETLTVLLQDGARFDALLAEVAAFDLAADPAREPENRIAQRLAAELSNRRPRLF